MSNFVFGDQGIIVHQAFGKGSAYLITNTILKKISRNLNYDESRIKVGLCIYIGFVSLTQQEQQIKQDIQITLTTLTLVLG